MKPSKQKSHDLSGLKAMARSTLRAAMEEKPKPQTLSVEEAAVVLGIGRNQAYEGVRTGEIPSIRIGKRLLVPKAALERMLAEAKPKSA